MTAARARSVAPRTTATGSVRGLTRVLIGYSRCQLTRAAFEAAGCEVWTCDLLPAPGQHLQCDIWDVAGDRWDMAVFHPMCTYLTVSAAWAFTDGPYHQKVAPGTLVGQERREAREEAIENFRRLLALPYPKAIENPARSFVSKAIRPCDQAVQPYQFGDDASKLTGLWLDRLPRLRPTAFVPGRMVPRAKAMGKSDREAGCQGPDHIERWSNQTDTGQNRLTPGATRWLERSATYPGIAAAFGDQWGQWINRRLAA